MITLLEFMKLQKQPNVHRFDLDKLLEVGEAAQKYMVYCATQVIRLEIMYVLPSVI